jgi:LuxR family transcriptional regulator, maltose regulon positive regulatory protein
LTFSTITLECITELEKLVGSPNVKRPQLRKSSLGHPLSDRELEILQFVAIGYSNQEIADQLFIGVSTVKKHINHIYDKLDVKSRTQAVGRARQLGLLD